MSETNEAGRTPSEIQQAVNNSPYFGITEDFEGWFIRGKHTYIWKLKKIKPVELSQLRKASAEYEELQQKAEMGVIQASAYDAASDDLTKKIYEFGLEDFINQDWEALQNDGELSRGDINDCGTALYFFLMRVTTKRAAMRLLRPLQGTPNTSAINRDWRKSGN